MERERKRKRAKEREKNEGRPLVFSALSLALFFARAPLSERLEQARATEAHTAGAYPGFRSMKQLRVLLLPPGRDASPSQGNPQQYVASIHLYTWVERDNMGQSILSKETTRWHGLGVEPPTFRSEVQRADHYTTAPPYCLLL